MRLTVLRSIARGSAAALFIFSFLLASCARAVRVEDGMAITNVTIVDVLSGSLKHGMTVAISGDQITVVRPSRQVRLAPGVERVPGTGKFLVPGFWDMHVHLQGTARHVRQVDLPVYIANGVTGVRLMSGDCDPAYIPPSGWSTSCMSDTTSGNPPAELVATWRREIGAGSQVGPRIVASSMLFDGTRRCHPGYAVEGPEQAREKVRDARRRGADFLKIYNCSLDSDTYYAIAEEARRLGIDFAGHVPPGVTFSQASAAGQKSIEHFGLPILAECSTSPGKVAEGRKALREQGYSAYNDLLIRTFDVAACEQLIENLLVNGTALVPTFAVFERKLRDDLRVEGDKRLRYLVAETLAWWRQAVDQRTVDPSLQEQWRRMFLQMFEAVVAMDRRGVPILAGSDAPNLLVYPGFGLHDELELLVEAGLTPAAALRAATLNPARFLGRADDLGTVEEGKRADLVLLEGNPLNEIRSTTTINAVVAAGRVFDRATLDSLLAAAATAAAQ